MRRLIDVTVLVFVAASAVASDPCADPWCADEGFGASGRVAIDFAYGDADRGNAVVRVPGKDRIYIIGQVATAIVGDHDFGVACLLDNGDRCPDFGNSGTSTVAFDLGGNNVDAAVSGAIVPWGVNRDWRLVVAGQVERATAGDTDFGVALLRPDGSLESEASGGKVNIAFDTPGTDFTDLPAAVAVTGDGKILVGGTVDVAAGDSDWGFARLNADLTPDTTFDNDGRAVLDVAGLAVMHAMLIQPDGKIVAVGSRDFGGNDQMVITRLNTDGSPDTFFGILGQTVFSFSGPGSSDAAAWALTTDRDGRFVMVGEAIGASGHCMMAARVLANGQPDSTFNAGSATSEACYSMAVAGGRAVATFPDGHLVVAFESDFQGDHDFAVFERTALDPVGVDRFYSFDLGGSNDDRPRGMLIQPDGKIIIAGRVVGSGDTLDFGVLRIWSHQVFADGFEAWGSAAEWDTITTAP